MSSAELPKLPRTCILLRKQGKEPMHRLHRLPSSAGSRPRLIPWVLEDTQEITRPRMELVEEDNACLFWSAGSSGGTNLLRGFLKRS